MFFGGGFRKREEVWPRREMGINGVVLARLFEVSLEVRSPQFLLNKRHRKGSIDGLAENSLSVFL